MYVVYNHWIYFSVFSSSSIIRTLCTKTSASCLVVLIKINIIISIYGHDVQQLFSDYHSCYANPPFSSLYSHNVSSDIPYNCFPHSNIPYIAYYTLLPASFVNHPFISSLVYPTSLPPGDHVAHSSTYHCHNETSHMQYNTIT